VVSTHHEEDAAKEGQIVSDDARIEVPLCLSKAVLCVHEPEKERKANVSVDNLKYLHLCRLEFDGIVHVCKPVFTVRFAGKL
jgi:hypothetical protein